ncbi:hypothetical protein UFOVP133_65 [uncultured Caudovirales phage]|uniref:Uncharacterized protein n=1 Tax=uncultured Caudovirales phage TaxID=2100421 RepID=A0A6J5LCW9_9CAUD|nr:hypothetical protein UFOVP133_65 [uncultured Caudovirales phage]
MSLITPMEAYATTDGRLHTNQAEAQAHQYGIDIKKEVCDFFDYNQSHLSYFDTYGATKVRAVIEWETKKKLKELKEQE